MPQSLVLPLNSIPGVAGTGLSLIALEDLCRASRACYAWLPLHGAVNGGVEEPDADGG